MLPQTMMIERIRDLCQHDHRIVAATLYGSFSRGEGDKFSDIDCVLFVADSALPLFDQQDWVAQIATLALYFDDDNSHHTAIFENLIRGEFHFNPVSEMAKIASWKGNAWFPSCEAAILLDRTGELAHRLADLVGPAPIRDTPAQLESLRLNFINWVLFGAHVLARGEYARSLEILAITHRYLLWMVRLIEATTEHWPTPTRALEQDISHAAYQRFAACTATLDPIVLRLAYIATWRWGRELLDLLADRYSLPLSLPLFDQLTAYLDKINAHE